MDKEEDDSGQVWYRMIYVPAIYSFLYTSCLQAFN